MRNNRPVMSDALAAIVEDDDGDPDEVIEEGEQGEGGSRPWHALVEIARREAGPGDFETLRLVTGPSDEAKHGRGLAEEKPAATPQRKPD